MEGILIMLLYLIAGFFKNRKDKAKRRKIQSDPNWDKSKSSNDFNSNFENFFKDFVGDDIEKTQNNANKPIKRAEIVDQASNTQKSDSRESAPPYIEKTQNSSKAKKVSNIQDSIRKKEKKRNYNVKLNLNNKSSIRRAIILKEVLGKPISLR